MNKEYVLQKIKYIENILDMDEEEYKKHFEERFEGDFDENTWYASRTGEVSALVTLLKINITNSTEID